MVLVFGCETQYLEIMTSLVNYSELERQIALHQEQVSELTAQLEGARNRLANLHMMRRTAQLLEAETAARAEEGLTYVDMGYDYFKTTANTPVGDGTPVVIQVKDAPKKIRSTQMVTDMILESQAYWTRQEVHDGFLERYPVPESWSNPANAINNALGRAVKTGLIVEHGGHYMASDLAADTSRNELVHGGSRG